MLKTYLPDNIVLPKISKQHHDLTVDDVVEIPNGTIILDYNFNKRGVYDACGQLCPESVLLRWCEKPVPAIKRNMPRCDFINEEVIYIGTAHMFLHFGHFLIEGISRIWPLLYKCYKNKKVVIALGGKRNIPLFVRKTLNAIGVKDQDIIVIHKNTRFASVLVPKQSTNIGVNILPITSKVFDKISNVLGNAKIKTYDKIYLSRSAMKDGRTFGEKNIEKIFTKNGYKVIYPETLQYEHQITLAKNCKVLAGTAGSALHLALFMKPKNRVVQIKRNSMNSDNVDVQQMVCDLRGLDMDLVAGSIETFPTSHYTKYPQILGVTPQMIKFFDDNGFVYSADDINPDEIAQQEYEHQLKKYKTHVAYAKILNPFIRIISLFGITKKGRGKTGDFLRQIFNAEY